MWQPITTDFARFVIFLGYIGDVDAIAAIYDKNEFADGAGAGMRQLAGVVPQVDVALFVTAIGVTN